MTAGAGATALFADLHDDLSWRGDHLLARDGRDDPGPARTVILGPAGLVSTARIGRGALRQLTALGSSLLDRHGTMRA